MQQQITMHESNNQLLYFTSTSLMKNGKGLVFLSDRSGFPNIYYKDLITDQETQLTFQQDGLLKSYVYFDGTPYFGFGKASVSLDAERGMIYYLQGRDIMSVDLNGRSRVLNQLPEKQMTGFTHVSADGRLLCVPTVDAEAFDVKDYFEEIDNKIQSDGLNSYLRVYDTKTGEEVMCETVHKAWVTHVQFSPINSRHILYNHEWIKTDPGIRRLWLFNGESHIRLRTKDEQRSENDWVCHEMWEKDGKHVIYHGGFENGTSFIGRVNVDDLSYSEIPIDKKYTQYGHFTVKSSGMLVSDGYYRTEGQEEQGWAGAWISLQKADWDNKTIEWIPLCRHHSSWDCQCSHPHPIFDEAENYVYFTSDKTGRRQIHRISTTDTQQDSQ